MMPELMESKQLTGWNGTGNVLVLTMFVHLVEKTLQFLQKVL